MLYCVNCPYEDDSIVYCKGCGGIDEKIECGYLMKESDIKYGLLEDTKEEEDD